MLMVTTCSYNSFIDLLKIDKYSKRSFCFILGSGCSRSSGYPTGNQLAQEWFEYFLDHNSDYKDYPSDIKEWIRSSSSESNEKVLDYLKIENRLNAVLSQRTCAEDEYPRLDDLLRVKLLFGVSESYCLLASWRFRNDAEYCHRYFEELNQKCVKPSSGYQCLADILFERDAACDIVITTNFDTLISRAVNERGNAIHHYTSSVDFKAQQWYLELANPMRRLEKPLIIPVHNSLDQTELFNTAIDTRYIKENMFEVLDLVLAKYIPIVIGYSGLDIAFMDYLARTPNLKGGRMYWLQFDKGYDQGFDPDRILSASECKYPVRRVLNHVGGNGYLVPCQDFDVVMRDISKVLLPDTTSSDKKAESVPKVSTDDINLKGTFNKDESSEVTKAILQPNQYGLYRTISEIKRKM